MLFEKIRFHDALLGKEIEREHSERFRIIEDMIDLLCRIACSPIACQDRACAHAIDCMDLVPEPKLFQSFDDAQRIEASCPSSGDDQDVLLLGF